MTLRGALKGIYASHLLLLLSFTREVQSRMSVRQRVPLTQSWVSPHYFNAIVCVSGRLRPAHLTHSAHLPPSNSKCYRYVRPLSSSFFSCSLSVNPPTSALVGNRPSLAVTQCQASLACSRMNPPRPRRPDLWRLAVRSLVWISCPGRQTASTRWRSTELRAGSSGGSRCSGGLETAKFDELLGCGFDGLSHYSILTGTLHSNPKA